MKKVVIIVVILLVVGGGGFYYCYNAHLRFTDAYTDCPVAAFRAQATSADSAANFVTEESLGSLQNTEKCSVDCRHDNKMACVLYGLAVEKGVFTVQSESESQSILSKACSQGETLACDLEQRAKRLKEEKEKELADEARKEANKSKLLLIGKEKGGAVQRKTAAVAHFKGGTGAMKTPAMKGWYEDTIQYLLYDKPALYQMHKIPGVQVKKGLELKEFIENQYLSGDGEPDIEMIKAFLDKFKRLGVMQIRLDYYVEKKKESEIKKTHGYFRAKHTFLYHVAEVELELLERLEKIFS